MIRIRSLCLATTSACLLASFTARVAVAQESTSQLGLFEGHSDVGEVLHPGSAEYDHVTKTYTLTGSGENMWFAKDDFQFVWKKVSAESLSLSADIALPGTGGDNHRKVVLMIRQSLDADAPYADLARHGDGLTSLQFRNEKGEVTHEVESNVSGPSRLRIDKRGDRFYMWIGNAGQQLQFAGGSKRVTLKAPFYVGIGVCAHNKDAVQKAIFTNVDLRTIPTSYSTLETVAVASTDARVSYVTEEAIESATWSADGASLLFRAGGGSERVPLSGGSPETAAAGTGESNIPADADPRVSPDGKQTASLASEGGELVLSVTSMEDKKTKVVAKFTGGRGSLSAHPWSPDGKRLAFISHQSVD